jgi:MFS family permease
VSGAASAPARSAGAIPVAALLVCCTVLGLAGTDLVLPAIPGLPAALGGDLAQAQLVLATFAAGSGVGLLLFGELGARIEHARLLVAAMLAYALLSGLAGEARSLPLLIALRFLQGVAASCAAVVTPGMVRRLFDERGALRALGALGSIESLAPAVAPIIGLWLLDAYGWRASFRVTALLALCLAALVFLARRALPAQRGNASRRGYWLLLRNVDFQRQALSQGLALASLLTLVFAMPGVFVVALGGSLRDFITMQLIGIASFIVAANLSSHLVARIGSEPAISAGSLLALAGGLGLLAYGVAGGRDALTIQLLFVPFNMGFGFRGPPAFYAALQASAGDDGRASALVILYTMLMTAAATALIAPLLAAGLWAPALAAALLGAASLLLLRLLPAPSLSRQS